MWESLPSKAFTTDVFFFPFLMRLIGEVIKPMPSGFKRKAQVPSCVRKMRVVATAVGSGIFFLSLFFFAFVSSAESRECSFSSRQRDEPNQPHLSIMQGATPSPPVPNIIYFYNISRMFNLISSTYKSPRMNNAGAKQLHSGFASVIDMSLLLST